MSDLLTTEEAAAILRINAKRVQALARSGQLPAVRSGRRWLFPRAALMQTLRTETPTVLTTDDAEPVAAPGSISARNQLRGRITKLVVEGLMAEVHISIGGQTLVSVITSSSAQRLQLAEGREVLAVIKSTEVMVGIP